MQAMPQMGQKRRLDGPAVTSGLPRAADVGTRRWQVSKVPEGDVVILSGTKKGYSRARVSRHHPSSLARVED